MSFKKFMKGKAKDFVEQRNIKNVMDENISKDALKKLAKKLHLKTSGNKGNLINQILGSPDFSLDILQNTFTLTELKQICAKLKLETTGSKDDLWNRILVKKGIIDQKKQQVEEIQEESSARIEQVRIPATIKPGVETKKESIHL